MTMLKITAGPFAFAARLEEEDAPRTCEYFRKLLPYRSRLIHVRWSGEGVWIPLGNGRIDLPFENHTCHPSKGEFLFYPGGLSEAEIILAYGGVSFSSKVGPLAGNHFLTITEGLEQLPELGKRVLWEGAQEIRFEAAS
jgi:hypothetical protein